MLLGQVPVEFGTVFPSGAYATGGFEKVRDFDKSKGDLVVQQNDKTTGLPLWVIEVIDPQEGTRQLTVKVKVKSKRTRMLKKRRRRKMGHRRSCSCSNKWDKWS